MWVISYYPAYARVRFFFYLILNIKTSTEINPVKTCQRNCRVQQVRMTMHLKGALDLTQHVFSVQPRANVARLAEKKDVSPELIARLHRIEGAHAVSKYKDCALAQPCV